MKKKITFVGEQFGDRMPEENEIFITSIRSGEPGLIHIEFKQNNKSFWIQITMEEARRIGFINLNAIEQYCI